MTIWYLPTHVKTPEDVTGPLWYRIHKGVVQRSTNDQLNDGWAVSSAYGIPSDGLENFLRDIPLMTVVNAVGDTAHPDYAMDEGL